MVTLELAPTVRIHGFQTGTVAVTQEHYAYSGGGLLRIPRILFGQQWTPALPIWVWALETLHGRYLIDTGESTAFYDPNHFGTDHVARFINRRILDIKVTPAEHIDQQLRRVGLSADAIDAVILTHLHIDHTDGLAFFPKATVLVAQAEWDKPIGAAFSTFPKWFVPQRITYGASDLPFGARYQVAPDLHVVPTPGHTFGHQSVVFTHGDTHFVFAGDTTFNESQLLTGQVAGISASTQQAVITQARIRAYCRQANAIYMPSHDAEAGSRLCSQQLTVVIR